MRSSKLKHIDLQAGAAAEVCAMKLERLSEGIESVDNAALTTALRVRAFSSCPVQLLDSTFDLFIIHSVTTLLKFAELLQTASDARKSGTSSEVRCFH